MTSVINSVRSFTTLPVVVIFAGVMLLFGTAETFGQKTKPTPKPSPKTVTKTTPANTNAGKCAGSSLTADEVNQALALHNSTRTALKISELKWDCKLAAMAQEWADRGVFEHRDTPYGENMFVSASTNLTMNPMVDMWLAEKAFWNNKTGTCAAGKTCGHYTQIVWKSTTKVGCGINRNASGKWKLLFVCNYDPSGNTGGPAF